MSQPDSEISNAVLFSPGETLDSLGTFMAFNNLKGVKVEFRIYIVRGTSDNLLSRGVAQEHSLIQRIDKMEGNIFDTHGRMKCDPVKIVLREGAEPYCLTTPRRVAFPLLQKITTTESLSKFQQSKRRIRQDGTG